MEAGGCRDFRTALHFTAPKMWLNDPNGMVYENGNYHLFYQHNPVKNSWGPMHWGHAVSEDLIHWHHLPVALYPDELGQIFSGSAVYDKDNTSGFVASGKVPIVAVYTSHGECEQQSIAYSTDGVHFEKYKGNPVIANPGISDFRDPKVFWNDIRHCWGLVLAAKDRVHFYSSVNLRDWVKTGEFGPEGNFAPGVWECPDFFPLPTPEGQKWILLVSMGMSTENGGGRIQYFTGGFDGDTFLCDGSFSQPEFFDQGFDSYAGVTYSNTGERIFMSWGTSPSYAGDTPTADFRGIMTLPKRLSLVQAPRHGYRLATAPFPDYSADSSTVIQSGHALLSSVFGLNAEGQGGCSITFLNSLGEQLVFGVDDDNAVFVDRSKAGDNSFSKAFASEIFQKRSVPRFFDGSYRIEAVFDVCSLEFFIDKGTRSFSQVVYPSVPYDTVKIEGNVKVELSIINT